MNWLWKIIKAIIEALRKPGPEIKPIPKPEPVPVPEPSPGHPETLIIADMLLIPDQMRQAGFQGRDTALWYSLSRQIAWGDFGFENEGGIDGELKALHDRQGEIVAWWDKRVQEIIKQMRENSLATVTIIVNDGPERCGRQLSLGTMNMFPDDLKPRVQLGETVPD